MPMKASELRTLYTLTKNQYDDYEGNNSHAALADRVKNNTPSWHDTGFLYPQEHIDHVVQMYLEIKNGSSNNYSSYAGASFLNSSSSPSSSAHSSGNTSSSFSMPSFTYVDNSWNWGDTNTTNINTSSSNTKNKKEEKDSSLEQLLIKIGVTIGLVFLGFIAAVSFGSLFSEIYNHASRLFNNEGAVQGSLLLMGVATSYCLAMLSIYEIAGGLLMGTMMAAGFANPAAWGCAAIALSALIAVPLFNMVIREGIYALFSWFDDQALVSTDNRFRMLTPTEVDSLDDKIDPDRINFATLCKYDELKPTQTRQRFAFFDYNSPEMNNVLKETRAMRSATQNKSRVDIKLPESDKVSFSLFKAARPSFHAPPAPSAPPGEHGEFNYGLIPEATAVYN